MIGRAAETAATTMSEPKRVWTWRRAAVAAVLVLSALRLVLLWLSWRTPVLPSADESAEVFRSLRYGSGDFTSQIAIWGALPSYLLFGVFGAFYVVGRATGLFDGTDDFLRLYAEDPDTFVALGRTLFCVVGVVLLEVVRRAVTAHVDARASLWAVLAIGLFPLTLGVSVLVKADGLAIVFLLLAAHRAHVALPLARETAPSRAALALVGVLFGAALACKYHVIFAAPAALFPLWSGRTRIGAGGLTVVAGSMICTFLLTNPTVLLEPTRFFVGDYGVLGNFRHQDPRKLAGYERSQLPGFFEASTGGAVVSVAMAISLVLGLFDRRAFVRACCWSALSFLTMLCAVPYVEAHHVLPVLPFVAIAFGAAVSRGAAWGRAGWAATGLAVGVLVTLVPVALSRIETCATESTVTAAENWIETHLPADARVVVDWAYVPRLRRNGASLKRELADPGLSSARRRLISALAARPPSPAYDVIPLVHRMRTSQRADEQSHFDVDRYRREGVRYAVVSSRWYGRFFRPPLRPEDDGVRAFYSRLLDSERVLRTFRRAPRRAVGPRIDVVDLGSE